MVKTEITLFCIYKKIMETLNHHSVPSHFQKNKPIQCRSNSNYESVLPAVQMGQETGVKPGGVGPGFLLVHDNTHVA